MNKRIVSTAAVFGLIAVILGAFGAHTLKERIGTAELATWAKGVEYQFYHVFGLLFLATQNRLHSKFVGYAYWFFSIGIVFFSGSLYLLSTREISQIQSLNFIGPITPVGGLLFILGWIMILVAALKQDDAR
jgi:uncharacterized membrane protein YgdD (TMEM256/DUF423 family)